MTWTAPTPGEQVQFLRNVQRLLAEGLFVASYKFALVHALADLAVLRFNFRGVSSPRGRSEGEFGEGVAEAADLVLGSGHGPDTP